MATREDAFVARLETRVAPPGHPMAGTNLRASQAMMQWQGDKLVVVYPPKLATADVVLPLPPAVERLGMFRSR